ncbi:hypothetical protein FIU90_04690 [Erythrobacter sp. THAF29]|nr:hypothetical protein FIU90_04690 [Erythrobacter sp. THAF29]
MATGALLLPAMGLAATTAATIGIRKKFPRSRKLDKLLPFEVEILFCTDQLIRPLDGVLEEKLPSPSRDELRAYANDGLRPLLRRIVRHISPQSKKGQSFSDTLNPNYQGKLQEHCWIVDKHAEILSAPERRGPTNRAISWLKLLRRNIAATLFSRQKTNGDPQIFHFSSVVMAVTFQRLLEDRLTAWGLEHDLVLEALRRSTNRLNDASVDELSEYVRSLSPEQLRGVISNTKGIYHELLFVAQHNSKGGTLTASAMETTNFPGADVQFSMNEKIVQEVQLKAVDSPTLVYEHLKRYPDIEIVVTEEVAAMLEGIDSSGFYNAILAQEVNERLLTLQGQGLLEEVSDGLLTSAFVTSGILIFRVCENKNIKIDDFRTYLRNAGIAVGTASAVDSAFSMAENLP